MYLLIIICTVSFLVGVISCRLFQVMYCKIKSRPTGWFVSLIVGKETQFVGILPKNRNKFLEIKKRIRRMYPVLTSNVPEKPPDIIGKHKTMNVDAGSILNAAIKRSVTNG